MRFNGVFLKQDRGHNPPKFLAGLVNEENYHNWTDKEMIEQYESPRGAFNTRLRFSSYAALTTGVADASQQSLFKPETKPVASESNNIRVNNLSNPQNNQEDVKQERMDNPIQRSSHYTLTGNSYTIPQTPKIPQKEEPYNWDNAEVDCQKQYVKDHVKMALRFSRELGNLAKFYNDDMKYGGAEDSLDMCLDIFVDPCKNAGLPPLAHSLGTPTMLKRNARKYYYQRISKLKLGHEDSIRRLKRNLKRKPDVKITWRSVIIQKNPNMSLMEFFESLLDKLPQLQGGLSERMIADKSARDRLQVACQMVSACSKACFTPNPTSEGITAEIRNVISTERRLVRVNAFYEGDVTSTNFTDRNFRGPHYERKNLRIRDKNREKRHGNHIFDKPKSKRQKKCIVCSREGCWSTNHSSSQQKEAYDHIKARVHDLNRPHKDHHVRQFILEF
ncbi:hypothetical protein Golomagni_03114 [Golovinomyces magnicellulatus]|nr:hypothetical protein Golomagni_03114 [Golovinomyces magnicellulatus]